MVTVESGGWVTIVMVDECAGGWVDVVEEGGWM